jgi:hypothetical protein
VDKALPPPAFETDSASAPQLQAENRLLSGRPDHGKDAVNGGRLPTKNALAGGKAARDMRQVLLEGSPWKIKT